MSDCESDIIHGVASVSAWSLDKSFLIKLHASSSCSFVTTADLHSAVELAKDIAAVPTPTATGAARFTACIGQRVFASFRHGASGKFKGVLLSDVKPVRDLAVSK